MYLHCRYWGWSSLCNCCIWYFVFVLFFLGGRFNFICCNCIIVSIRNHCDYFIVILAAFVVVIVLTWCFYINCILGLNMFDVIVVIVLTWCFYIHFILGLHMFDVVVVIVLTWCFYINCILGLHMFDVVVVVNLVFFTAIFGGRVVVYIYQFFVVVTLVCLTVIFGVLLWFIFTSIFVVITLVLLTAIFGVLWFIFTSIFVVVISIVIVLVSIFFLSVSRKQLRCQHLLSLRESMQNACRIYSWDEGRNPYITFILSMVDVKVCYSQQEWVHTLC